MPSTPKKRKKKNFASFNTTEAFKQLSLKELLLWQVDYNPIAPSPFFQERWARLQCFDLQKYEESKKIVIDAICEEAIQPYKNLKIWKGAALESDITAGNVYLYCPPFSNSRFKYTCLDTDTKNTGN